MTTIIVTIIIIIMIIIAIEITAHINKPLTKDHLLDIDKFCASSLAFVCLDDKEKRASNTRFAVSFSSYITCLTHLSTYCWLVPLQR